MFKKIKEILGRRPRVMNVLRPTINDELFDNMDEGERLSLLESNTSGEVFKVVREIWWI